MSISIDGVQRCTDEISYLINSGKAKEAATLGNEFVANNGVPVNAHFWFQMRLAYLLTDELKLASGALRHMRADTESYSPEMARDCDRDFRLMIIRRRRRLTNERRYELGSVYCFFVSNLLRYEDHPNRLAVTYYAIGRAHAALGEHRQSLENYARAETLWVVLESTGRQAQIDPQWRRNNNFRWMLECASHAQSSPAKWHTAKVLADVIISDVGELEMNRKRIARVLRFFPFAYWPIKYLVGN